MDNRQEITEELLRELPKAILNWYPFKEGKRVLLLSYTDELLDIYKEMLITCGMIVTAQKVSEYEEEKEISEEAYEYVVLADAVEYLKTPQESIDKLAKSLADDGIMLIAMDNRLGLRYFCGDRDVFTGRNFDSVENYRRINEEDRANLAGRAYSKAEVVDYLTLAGLCDAHSFSVLPCVEEPQLFYAEDYLPEEELDIRFNFHYRNPDTIFLEEERLYSTLIKNGMFHQMAGGYLIECGKKVGEDAAFYTTKHLTISMERGRKDAMATIIRRDNTVVKKAIYPEGKEKLEILADNEQYLRDRGIKVVEGKISGDEYIMPYIKGESAVTYFRRLLYTDVQLLYRELSRFFEIILKSSDYVTYEDIDWVNYAPFNEKQKADDPNKLKWQKIAFSKPDALGKIMKKGFIDMVSLNCFVVDGEFVFYDQEFTVENLPCYTILWRTISFIYWGDSYAQKIYPIEKLYHLMGLGEYAGFYASFSHKFIGRLRHWRELSVYHKEHVRDANVLNSNRQRMNYSQEEYQRLFVDIFKGVQGRTLYLFGSGNYAKKFLSQFGKKFHVDGILDNNESRQGTDLLGINIFSPDILKDMDPAKYKVIICIKNYVPVLKQLKAIGATNISFFDWNLEYEHEKYIDVTAASTDKKPYHIGYIAGVFDLFHVGHLNLLRRAKEQCDYLIVGVVSDEGVINSKKTTPYVGFSERIDIVRSCKYVDEAVEIPVECNDTDEAYRRYQFDVQFSGSDYADDPDWLAKRDYLRKRGADLVFFPYTQSTSSTKLKSVISENIPKKKESKDDVVSINLEDNKASLIAFMTNPAIDPHRPNQGFDIHKNAGINGMVLNLGDYCGAHEIEDYGKKVVSINVQRYEKVTDNPKLLWQYAMEEVRIAKEKNMKLPIIIAPRRLRDSKRDDLDDILYELAYQTIQLCKDSGTKNVLIYPNSYNQADIESITAWYDRLVPVAKECKVTILISNQCKDVSGHLVRGVFAHTYEAIEWIDAQNEKHGADTFGFCADIGCYNLCGQRLKEVCEELGGYIKAVIIRENDGHADSSMLPYTCVPRGAAETDYMGLIRGLRTIDYEGMLILDMFDTCAGVPTKLREGLVVLGKNFMDFLEWQVGMEKGLKRYNNRVLFGAGNMCRAYMKCYGEEFPPLFTCDNNPKMWGTEFCGLTVKNPECLMSLPDDCVIYICNMFYNEIKQQLEDMGVTNPIEFFNDEYLPSYHFNRI